MSKSKENFKWSFRYLWAPKGYWTNTNTDVDDEFLDMSDMSNDHLNRCINTLEKYKSQIERFSVSYHEEDIKQMRDNKVDQLKNELKSRGFE